MLTDLGNAVSLAAERDHQPAPARQEGPSPDECLRRRSSVAARVIVVAEARAGERWSEIRRRTCQAAACWRTSLPLPRRRRKRGERSPVPRVRAHLAAADPGAGGLGQPGRVLQLSDALLLEARQDDLVKLLFGDRRTLAALGMPRRLSSLHRDEAVTALLSRLGGVRGVGPAGAGGGERGQPCGGPLSGEVFAGDGLAGAA